MSANSISLIRRDGGGWWMGLGNMLAKELSSWWRTRRWWVQCLAAVALLNGTMALNMKGGNLSGAAMNFLFTSALFVPLAAISLAQDTILGERHSGTAAWVFTKPLRRPAFIVAKVIAHGWGLLLAWVLLPVAIAYFQIGKATGDYPDAVGFVKAMGLMYLNLFFYFTLALMLTTLFNGRGPVLGIGALLALGGPLGFIAQPINQNASWLMDMMPWILTFPVGDKIPLVGYVANGQPLPTLVPIIATVLWCVLFVAVAIWRIRREEF